ncbi:hypothetical protein OOK36_45105 [Streptomyces sp. NBC_00365]|uniref:hypothetical protein n=1 Tax=Streptomyces sp. NBC_00365 TaxID=2975726 RepID=UPI002256B8FC|nr:hypothetical protein [Streptomyces sp. NBC_00365]MCX5095868.1 hypothetical protein [Streptomyces sp. NBC_00365]
MGHNVVPSILGGLAGLAAATVGAPWWCIVLIAGIALAAGTVQTLFPQSSEDKLQWWINRRQYLGYRYRLRELRRTRKRSS